MITPLVRDCVQGTSGRSASVAETTSRGVASGGGAGLDLRRPASRRAFVLSSVRASYG